MQTSLIEGTIIDTDKPQEYGESTRQFLYVEGEGVVTAVSVWDKLIGTPALKTGKKVKLACRVVEKESGAVYHNLHRSFPVE